jgi:hypothetical protein
MMNDQLIDDLRHRAFNHLDGRRGVREVLAADSIYIDAAGKVVGLF